MTQHTNGYVRFKWLIGTGIGLAVIFFSALNRVEDKMVPRTEFSLIMESLSEIKTDVKANGEKINDNNIKITKLQVKNISLSGQK